ncbi:hypothetical protein V8B55DRAFT_1340477, partial [Mucor lusitanicus]
VSQDAVGAPMFRHYIGGEANIMVNNSGANNNFNKKPGSEATSQSSKDSFKDLFKEGNELKQEYIPDLSDIRGQVHLRGIIQERQQLADEEDRSRVEQYDNLVKPSTPFEAQQWLGRLEILADYLGCASKERTEELVAVFKGHSSLDWFIDLDPTIKQDWEKVKQVLLHTHAQGRESSLVVFDELKAYTQGDKPMKVFGPGLTTSLLHQAAIYSPSIQLEYLKERLSPLLEQAVRIS